MRLKNKAILALEWLLSPCLFLVLSPYAWGVLFDVFSGQWEKRAGKTLWSFGEQDRSYRGWYMKIAKDYALRGRFGYAWDNGLGDDLSVKVYNNLVTYWLVLKLPATRFYGLALASLLLVLCGLAVVQFGWIPALIICFATTISPFIVYVMIRSSKPECFFWGISLLSLTLLFSGYFILAGLCWSVLAFCNLPCSIMVLLYGGVAGLVLAVQDGAVVNVLCGMLPGALKLGMRLFLMYKDGFMRDIVREQRKLWTYPMLPQEKEVIQLLPFLASMAVSGIMAGDPWFVLYTAIPALAFWANLRFIYYNDLQSTNFFLHAVAAAFSLAGQNPWAMLPLLYGLYPPANILFMRDVYDPKETRNLYIALAANYPMIEPQPYSISTELHRFFSPVTPFSRILAEYDGDPRRASPMRPFWSSLDLFRAEKKFALGNDMYLRLHAPEMATKIMSRFEPKSMNEAHMRTVIEGLGAKYVVACTQPMYDRLKSLGYAPVSVYELSPGSPLVLFATNIPDGVVSGTNTFKVSGKLILWNGKAKTPNTVRLRYSPRFKAFQGDEEIPVKPSRSIHFPITFMHVAPVKDGPVRLEYAPSWLAQLFARLRRN